MSKKLSAGKIWQIFCVLFLIWTAIVVVVWLLGFDFDAEFLQRRVIGLDLTVRDGTRRRIMVCGFVRTFLPGGVDKIVPCVVWNLAPFYIIPAFALVAAVKKTFQRS